MKKSMYSLMLNDEIINEIDKLAEDQGTNRSNLINKILADYTNLTTPEQRINSIYESIESFFDKLSNFESLLEPNDSTLSIKAPLTYKYKPTVKYDIQIYKSFFDNTIGELKIMFRTQYKPLLDTIFSFFEIFTSIEKKYLETYFPDQYYGYKFDNTKFTRFFMSNSNSINNEDYLAALIASYVKSIDIMLNKYINEKYKNEYCLEKDYVKLFLSNNKILI